MKSAFIWDSFNIIRIREKIPRVKDTKITQFDNRNQKLGFLHVISLKNNIKKNSIYEVKRKFFLKKFERIRIPRPKIRGYMCFLKKNFDAKKS